MISTFVLIMMWVTSDSRGGVAIIQQEFNSFADCEAARKHIAINNGDRMYLKYQGCHKK